MGQNSVIIDIICFIYQLRLLVSVGCSVRDGVSLELMFLLLVFVKVGSKMRFLCEEEVELGRKLAEKVSEVSLINWVSGLPFTFLWFCCSELTMLGA